MHDWLIRLEEGRRRLYGSAVVAEFEAFGFGMGMMERYGYSIFI